MSLNVKERWNSIRDATPPQARTTSVEATLLADTHCQLGECIIYDDIKDAILWTDIYGKQFYKLSLSGEKEGVVETSNLPSMLCAFGLLQEGGRGYICAWENGFQLYNLETNTALSQTSVGEDVTPAKLPTRLNDGRVAPDGQRFICGGYFGEDDSVKMKVFKCEYNSQDDKLTHAPIVDEIQVTNSVCFSPNGERMYLADSPSHQIHAYDYNKDTGSISNKTLLHTVNNGVPDGSCCDADGYLWNAVWRDGAGSSMVNRIDPATGRTVFTVNMPDATSQVSCCCLGGPDLDILFITTAAVGRDADKEPNAGAIYGVKVGFRGRKEGRLNVGK